MSVYVRELLFKDVDVYLNLLSQLSDIGEWDEEKKKNVFEQITSNEQLKIFVLADSNTDMIFAAATVLLEQKFLHGGSKVSHIEDVVVDKEKRGKGYGKSLIDHCIQFGSDSGAYKTILDCNESLKKFYESCGFHSESFQMRYNH